MSMFIRVFFACLYTGMRIRFDQGSSLIHPSGKFSSDTEDNTFNGFRSLTTLDQENASTTPPSRRKVCPDNLKSCTSNSTETNFENSARRQGRVWPCTTEGFACVEDADKWIRCAEVVERVFFILWLIVNLGSLGLIVFMATGNNREWEELRI